MAERDKLIEVRDLRVSFFTPAGEVKAVDGISYSLGYNEVMGVVGESGSGKTTMLKMLLKETDPDRGEIVVDGKRLFGITKAEIPFYRRSIGVVFQDFKLIQDLCVYDNLRVAILATGGTDRDAVNKITNVMTMLGIDHLHKRFPKELSGGEQQKVCLARAIINNPKILLVDEPTGNLDPAASLEINRLLQVINDQGITVVMATHDYVALGANNRRRIDLDCINKKQYKGA